MGAAKRAEKKIKHTDYGLQQFCLLFFSEILIKPLGGKKKKKESLILI